MQNLDILDAGENSMLISIHFNYYFTNAAYINKLQMLTKHTIAV